VSEGPPSLAVVVPLLNEAAILEDILVRAAKLLDETVGTGRWQLIPVDNGSRDASRDILRRLAARWPSTELVFLPKPDIGAALREGLRRARTEWAYVLPLDEGDSDFLRWSWTHRERYDLILGSKRADPTLNQQSPYRRILSWGLNGLLHLFFDFAGTDTHGQKLLRLGAMRPILERCVMSRGQFDTEFTLRAHRSGLRIAEVPVVYAELRPPRNFMATKIARNVKDLFRLRRAMRGEPFRPPLRYHRWSREDVVAGRLPAGDA
jgi:glycosyltransferase involved in cell wall biosynthesis